MDKKAIVKLKQFLAPSRNHKQYYWFNLPNFNHQRDNQYILKQPIRYEEWNGTKKRINYLLNIARFLVRVEIINVIILATTVLHEKLFYVTGWYFFFYSKTVIKSSERRKTQKIARDENWQVLASTIAGTEDSYHKQQTERIGMSIVFVNCLIPFILHLSVFT